MMEGEALETIISMADNRIVALTVPVKTIKIILIQNRLFRIRHQISIYLIIMLIT